VWLAEKSACVLVTPCLLQALGGGGGGGYILLRPNWPDGCPGPGKVAYIFLHFCNITVCRIQIKPFRSS
jgi:hypothetical protein